jgi:hypothetical protein
MPQSKETKLMDLRMNINIMEEYSAMNKYFFFTITVLG